MPELYTLKVNLIGVFYSEEAYLRASSLTLTRLTRIWQPPTLECIT